jgi:2-dehydro-3-deoxyphosphogluconate aldolase / (4S)-4-hydroxy-2-oxoglutarate aldolase
MAANKRPVEIILKRRVVAILRLADLKHAVEIARAIVDGGIAAIEFTLTNPQAPIAVSECLREIACFREGRATIGMGSVRTIEQLDLAMDSRAQFIVSPITSVSLIRTCQERGMAVMPGAMTPTEMAHAWDAGADIVKVFPARNLGPNYIKDCLAPMPDLRLMPTGGVDQGNIGSYLEAGAVAVGIGSQFLKPEILESQDWDQLRESVRPYTMFALDSAS